MQYVHIWEHKGNKWVVLRELLSTLHAISQKNHENSINRIKPLKSFSTRKNLPWEEGGKRKTWKKRRRISKQFNEFIAKSMHRCLDFYCLVSTFSLFGLQGLLLLPLKIGKISICYFYKGRGGGVVSVIFGFKATEWREKNYGRPN